MMKKSEKTYYKLVRDKIPEIIKKAGKDYVVHIASEEEYIKKLQEKVTEELEEFRENPCEEELADILEVLESIADFYKFDIDNIKAIQKRKRMERGGFKDRIVLEKVIGDQEHC